jgi:transposase
VSKRREVTSVVALTAPLGRGRPRLFARHFIGSVHGSEVVEGLRYFRRKAGRPLIIVWDRLQAHRSKEVADFVATHPDDFRIEWLPSYAPDTNPEEQCNAVVKREMLNALPGSVEELRRMARRSFERLQHRPQLLRSFFRHCRLSLH